MRAQSARGTCCPLQRQWRLRAPHLCRGRSDLAKAALQRVHHLSAREQQVPHRAFSPVRNDILFLLSARVRNDCPFTFDVVRICLKPSLNSCHSDARPKRARNLLSFGAAIASGVLRTFVPWALGPVLRRLSARVLGVRGNSRFLTGLSAPFGMTSFFTSSPIRNDIPFLIFPESHPEVEFCTRCL
jgi:hypothetical protein